MACAVPGITPTASTASTSYQIALSDSGGAALAIDSSAVEPFSAGASWAMDGRGSLLSTESGVSMGSCRPFGAPVEGESTTAAPHFGHILSAPIVPAIRLAPH